MKRAAIVLVVLGLVAISVVVFAPRVTRTWNQNSSSVAFLEGVDRDRLGQPASLVVGDGVSVRAGRVGQEIEQLGDGPGRY